MRRRECDIEEGHLLAAHVHSLVPIPPKYSVAPVVECIKGKSAIHIAGTDSGKRQNFVGQDFWARGYFVSTAGRDEDTVRADIKKQEEKDERLDRLQMFQ